MQLIYASEAREQTRRVEGLRWGETRELATTNDIDPRIPCDTH